MNDIPCLKVLQVPSTEVVFLLVVEKEKNGALLY